MNDLAENGHLEWYSDVPRSIARHTVLGLTVLFVALGSFGWWAFAAPLAAAVISQGSFVATGQNKIVQHLEGGVIQELMVTEGDTVTKGQPLLKLDETAALANERQLFLRRARLEAINARLDAQHDGLVEVDFPEYLMDWTDNLEVASIIASQKLNFETWQRKLQSDVRLLESNIDSLKFRAEGYDIQRKAMAQQLTLLKGELVGKKSLLEDGFIRQVEVNAIERAIADAEGEVGRLVAQVAETNAQIIKYDQQIEQTRAAHRQSVVDELQSIEAELDSVREQFRSAENVLQRALITAPVSGTVLKMYYHTAGGVVESGKSIAEILPSNVPLIIEIQVPRTDIDSINIGQPAMVRLTALNQRTTPVLNGNVFYISADSLPDTNNGARREVYVARVSLSASELQRVPGFTPTPGMPAEVMVQTEERTFFSYLAKPVVDSMARAFREQ